jgi:hypothetical protein
MDAVCALHVETVHALIVTDFDLDAEPAADFLDLIQKSV